MADIILKAGQEAEIKLKACGLSEAEIGKIVTALIPELEDRINSQYVSVVYPELSDINEQISNIKGQLNVYGAVLTNLENGKAGKDLSNVEDSVFLEKINAVLADGDEVSY